VQGAEGLDTIRPLWEKLRAHHAGLNWPFAAEIGRATFEPRKRELLDKSAGGALRVELATAGSHGGPVAYCVSTLSGDNAGEIDSLYVDAEWRGRGIGSELVRRALAWLDAADARSKIVCVAQANRDALALYARFGFHPRTVVMKQVET
jgi:ribosomal protein S18 acetylase RimI-like enzyme